ncbi:(2Fe-2S)-binding protein [Staphylococcus aureus]
MRKVCCLRDRLGQRLCAGCPKIDPAARDRLLAGQA